MTFPSVVQKRIQKDNNYKKIGLQQMSLFALFAAALFACRYVSFTTRQHTFYKLLTNN